MLLIVNIIFKLTNNLNILFFKNENKLLYEQNIYIYEKIIYDTFINQNISFFL